MIKSNVETVEIEVRLLKVTDRAYLVDPIGVERIEDLQKVQTWIPRSQVEDEWEKEDEGEEITLVVAEWLAYERGLI